MVTVNVLGLPVTRSTLQGNVVAAMTFRHQDSGQEFTAPSEFFTQGMVKS